MNLSLHLKAFAINAAKTLITLVSLIGILFVASIATMYLGFGLLKLEGYGSAVMAIWAMLLAGLLALFWKLPWVARGVIAAASVALLVAIGPFNTCTYEEAAYQAECSAE